MPYPKQTWTDNNASYPVSAARMGVIENGIFSAATVYNVKDSAYGAVGDGVADDTTAILAAISAAGATGTVFFPAGTYLHTQLTITGQTRLLGAGEDSVTLKAKTGAAGPLLNIAPASRTPGFYVGGFTIDMTNASGITALGMTKTSHSLVENISINKGDKGMSLGPDFYQSVVRHCRIDNCATNGVFYNADTGSESRFEDVHIDCTTTPRTTTVGFEYKSTTSTDTGGIYLDRVWSVQTGIGFKFWSSTAGAAPTIAAFLSQCVTDSCTSGMLFQKVSYAQIDNSWMSTAWALVAAGYPLTINACTMIKLFECHLDGGTDTGAIDLQASPSLLWIIGNNLDGLRQYNIDTANPPTKLVLVGNDQSSPTSLTNSEDKLAIAAAKSWQTGAKILTHSTSSSDSSLQIKDGATGTATPSKFLRVGSTGELEVLNNAYGAVILSVTDAGVVKLGGVTQILAGTGTPEAVVTAPVGSLFLRTDAATSLYVKQTGTGNTGWIAK